MPNRTPRQASSTRSVDIIVYPGFKALEAVGPMSVFEYANIHLQKQGRAVGYDVCIAATQLGFVQSDTLMALQASKVINTLAVAQDAVIVGTRHIQAALRDQAPIVEWVRAVAPTIQRLAALCSGTFFLAEAGVLSGKRATTHWSVAALLQEQFPSIEVDADAIFVRQDNVWTSAGVTAGIDLALAFVEEDFGRDLALAVASDMAVYLKRPGGQSQFSTHLMSQKTVKPSIREIQAWILQNLHHKLSISSIAERAMMSVRHFSRIFQHEVGLSTHEFIESARFEMARNLLAELDLPMKTVVARTGFTDDEQMRRVFQKRLGITAKVYRERFATTGVAEKNTFTD